MGDEGVGQPESSTATAVDDPYAYEGADPADVLDRADRLVQTFGMAQLATAFYAQLTRLDSGAWETDGRDWGTDPPGRW